MRSQKYIFRDMEIEKQIEGRADGLLHTVESSGKKAAQKAADPEECRICLECPRTRCALDTSKVCERLRRELKKLRTKKGDSK